VDFRFVGTDVDDEPSVGNNFSFWDGLAWDKEIFFRAGNAFTNTLRQSSKLICSGFILDREGAGIVDEMAVLKAGASIFIDDLISHVIWALFGEEQT
jgi:hypothetical protein